MFKSFVERTWIINNKKVYQFPYLQFQEAGKTFESAINRATNDCYVKIHNFNSNAAIKEEATKIQTIIKKSSHDTLWNAIDLSLGRMQEELKFYWYAIPNRNSATTVTVLAHIPIRKIVKTFYPILREIVMFHETKSRTNIILSQQENYYHQFPVYPWVFFPFCITNFNNGKKNIAQKKVQAVLEFYAQQENVYIESPIEAIKNFADYTNHIIISEKGSETVKSKRASVSFTEDSDEISNLRYSRKKAGGGETALLAQEDTEDSNTNFLHSSESINSRNRVEKTSIIDDKVVHKDHRHGNNDKTLLKVVKTTRLTKETPISPKEQNPSAGTSLDQQTSQLKRGTGTLNRDLRRRSDESKSSRSLPDSEGAALHKAVENFDEEFDEKKALSLAEKNKKKNSKMLGESVSKSFPGPLKQIFPQKKVAIVFDLEIKQNFLSDIETERHALHESLKHYDKSTYASKEFLIELQNKYDQHIDEINSICKKYFHMILDHYEYGSIIKPQLT